MNSSFLLILDVILLSRAYFYFRDDSFTCSKTMMKTLVETISVFFLFGFGIEIWRFVFVNIILNCLIYVFDRFSPAKRLNNALINLLLLIIALGFAFPHATTVIPLQWFQKYQDFFDKSFALTPLISSLPMREIALYLLGVLLAGVEANLLVRFAIERLKLKPKEPEAENGTQDRSTEYNRGRVIGILERLLIFFCFLTGNYAMVAFALTGKGIVRFQKMNDDSFAEYFLIGTLTSTLLAGAIGLIIRVLIAASTHT